MAIRAISFIKDLFVDGFRVVGLVAPLCSASFWISKLFFGAELELQDWSYAWGFLPITIWLAVAYFRRRNLYDTLEGEAQRERERFQPRLVGKIEQFSEGSTGAEDGPLGCMFNLTIKNQGAPSIVDWWRIDLVRANNERVRGTLPQITHETIIALNDGSYYAGTPVDGIYDKTSTQPIQQGGMARGWLLAVFPKVNRADLLTDDCFEITFQDVLENKYTASAKRDAGSIVTGFKYHPDGTGGLKLKNDGRKFDVKS